MKSIIQGLKIMCQRGWTQVEVEVDSLDFLHYLHGDIGVDEYLKTLPKVTYGGSTSHVELEFIRCMLKRCKCTLSHTPVNPWNRVALQLANMALNQEKLGLAVLEHSPLEVRFDDAWNEVAPELANMALNQEKRGLAVLEHPPVELGLVCLLKGRTEIEEDTRDEHPPQSTKVSYPPCNRRCNLSEAKYPPCKYCGEDCLAERRYRPI
ncbi:hypothetical protein NMG60_11015446 [Bertholletia excelsa]